MQFAVCFGLLAAGWEAGAQARLHWSFDETDGKVAHVDVENFANGAGDDRVEGFCRHVPGVQGGALAMDGMTTRVVRPAKLIPGLGKSFRVSAWVALDNYPWNWVPIADQSRDGQAGFSFGIDAFGHVGMAVAVGGKWVQVLTDTRLPLKRWQRVTASYDESRGIAVYVNGELAAEAKTEGIFAQEETQDLIVGRTRVPELPYPSWLIHPRDPFFYSLDGYLDELELVASAGTAEEERAAFAAVKVPAGDVMPYAVMPSGAPGPGEFGAYAETLKFSPNWDAPRRIGPDSDVVVRFEQSGMRLVFWQGLNYVPAWVTANGKWYLDEFLEAWGPKCVDGGDCEPMSDKQSRYSRVSVVASSAARVVVHWRYALVETRGGKGANVDPDTDWFDWADEYWTVYPDGVAVRKQVLWSSELYPKGWVNQEWQKESVNHEWQETIVINGPGQRPEDNIEPDALTLENMAGATHTYHWEPKKDESFDYPKGPAKLEEPAGANIQVVHLKSKEQPFQIVWPKGTSFDTYNAEKSYSMFEWWNHWPVAQIPSSGRPAVAADRPSHTSLSHIYWAAYGETEQTTTKLLMDGLTTGDAAGLLPLARSWTSPAAVTAKGAGVTGGEYDPAQRAFVVHRAGGAAGGVTVELAASVTTPVVNPTIVLEQWKGGPTPKVKVNGAVGKPAARLGVEKHLDGDALVVYLPVTECRPVVVTIEP